ncbi:hypothetical protein ANRL4_01828 [Anaerolineae bacterium]|nr:hypothetical protein ANRL4_01828 [Anaerolineae bacterium]
MTRCHLVLFILLVCGLAACSSLPLPRVTPVITIRTFPEVENTPTRTVSSFPEIDDTPTSTSAESADFKFNVLILGCNTGMDISHGLGEVTNIYALIQNAGTVEASDVRVVASANDEGQSHPDKSQTIQHLPPGYEVTFKLTVDTQFRQGTAVAVEVTNPAGLHVSASKDDCRQIDRSSLSTIELAIQQGIRRIVK